MPGLLPRKTDTALPSIETVRTESSKPPIWKNCRSMLPCSYCTETKRLWQDNQVMQNSPVYRTVCMIKYHIFTTTILFGRQMIWENFLAFMGMKSTAFSEDLLGLGLVGAISEKIVQDEAERPAQNFSDDT